MHVLLLVLEGIAVWTTLSFICACLWAIAGLRLTRMQERNRFAWNKPLRYLELDASQFRRLQ